ncbi:MAG: hypothetical protein WAK55_04155 [Xanthobacteraceae bacterium]
MVPTDHSLHRVKTKPSSKQQTNTKQKQIANNRFHWTQYCTSLPQNGHKQIKHLNGADRLNGEAAA